ncbi:MAG: tetratricopeptide repeat-containing sensor histidine kinase [Mucilaginibacter sp.]
MRVYLTFIFLLFYLTSSAAFTSSKIGNGGLDSIRTLLNSAPKKQDIADTANINRLNKLAEVYFQFNPDSTYYYAQKSIELSKKINYSSGLAGGLLQLGRANSLRGKTAEATKEFNSAVMLYKKLGDIHGLGETYIAYGRMYTLLADYKSALSCFNLALGCGKQLKDEHVITDAYKNTGIIYDNKGQLPNALDYYYKALFLAVKNHYKILSGEIYNDIGGTLETMEVYPNALNYFHKALNIVQEANDVQGIGTMHENIGEVLLDQKKYDQALVHLFKALDIAKKQNDIDGLTSLYTDVGLCYAHTNHLHKAIKYLDTSVQIAGKYKTVYNQAYAYIGLSTAYNMQKDYANAYKLALQGQALANKLGNISIRADAALQLSKTLTGLGKYKEANAELNQYLQLKNQIKDSESIQKLTSYNYDLNFTEKERQLEQQQRERDLLFKQRMHNQRLVNAIFMIAFVAMIVIAFVYYKQKRKQQKINAQLEEKNHEVLSQKTSIDEQAHKLNDLNILKDRLISVLAHDLRAPLSTLRGLFNLLQDASISHEELVEMIPTVLKKLEYTSDFLDTLLFWINSQMENFENSVKTFSVKEIASHEIESHYEQATLKGITLIDNVPEYAMACADPNSIRIVIRNLITNAIKFSKNGDVISVTAIAENGNIVISVRDTGQGISEPQLKKLFRNKVDSKTGTNNESGTGMGLLFCKDLIEKCNGRIWVTSKLGEGSEFTFTVPASVSVASSAAVPQV